MRGSGFEFCECGYSRLLPHAATAGVWPTVLSSYAAAGDSGTQKVVFS